LAPARAARSTTATAASRPHDTLARRGGWIELLRIPAALFGAIARARRAAYDFKLLPRERVPVPVVSVGNLTTGGTGKTPACAWVVHELERRGFRPGLLSRGYRAVRAGELNDEGKLLERLCPGVPHVQDKDRARGARELCARGVDVIVLDDGFQHRRLSRDLDLVLVDASRPWGLSAERGTEPVRALLPRGLLREPPSSLARADAIVITHSDAIDASALERLERELLEIAPGKPIVLALHRACAWRDERGEVSDLSACAGREVDLVSALGNPDAFEASVARTGAIVREHRVFPDHHDYAREDVAGLGTGGRALVTSGKDAVKLAPLGVQFLSLEIELDIARGAHVLAALLDALPLPAHLSERRALHAGLNG
jgi:tetraacyldisaccharide 4'-kinase